ncbi:hypothetical protein FLL45_22635 [Aliikangiella marina]|uniref:POTRA domain-containing protein n=1 Tax=Aliikangiella marina TaxID=1712262 RepID=A0A545T1P9_9GAMM|nr:hypothetical protein [Aliikangiella marina]TQV71125.1 hypothetical protein FLL45_22635 [Aliikangiella marina]
MNKINSYLTLAILAFSSASFASDDNCAEFSTKRVGADIVKQKSTFDEIFDFNKFPRIELGTNIEQLERILKKVDFGFGKIKINCSDNNFVYFTIITESKSSFWSDLKGFYKLQNGVYFSGPFTRDEITVVIQADPLDR